jgi:hypothetical protein
MLLTFIAILGDILVLISIIFYFRVVNLNDLHTNYLDLPQINWIILLVLSNRWKVNILNGLVSFACIYMYLLISFFNLMLL